MKRLAVISMKMAMTILLVSLLLVLSHAIKYIAPQGYVTDAAGILNPSDRQSLEQQLSSFERQTSNEIAILTIPSLEGESIEGYSNAVFSQWKIGKKGKNNGVLIVVASNDRKVRIEVGYGLEPILPDGLCGQIIREQIAPSFRQNNFSSGLSLAVREIQARIQGNTILPVKTHSNFRQISSQLISVLFFLLILLPFTTAGGVLAFFLIFLGKGLGPLRFLGLLFVPSGFALDLSRRSSRFSGGGGYWGTGGGFGGGSFGGSFGGFGGGSSGGGGASGGW